MRVINQNYYEVCVMVQYERLWRVVGETDLIQLVFCHPASVVAGGLVVRQTVLHTQDRGTNLLCRQIFSLQKCPQRKSQLRKKVFFTTFGDVQ